VPELLASFHDVVCGANAKEKVATSVQNLAICSRQRSSLRKGLCTGCRRTEVVVESQVVDRRRLSEELALELVCMMDRATRQRLLP
jgi:hypothetical protein